MRSVSQFKRSFRSFNTNAESHYTIKSVQNGVVDLITSCYRKLIDSLTKSLTLLHL